LIALVQQGDGMAAREYALRHGAETYIFDSDGVTGIHPLVYAGEDGAIYAGLYFTDNDQVVAAITRASLPTSIGGYVEVVGGNQVLYFAGWLLLPSKVVLVYGMHLQKELQMQTLI
jgi:hypothetical protein